MFWFCSCWFGHEQSIGQVVSVDMKQITLVKTLLVARDTLLEGLQKLSKAIDQAIDLTDFSKMNDEGMFDCILRPNLSTVDGEVSGQGKPQNVLEKSSSIADCRNDVLPCTLSEDTVVNIFHSLGAQLSYLWNTFLQFHRGSNVAAKQVRFNPVGNMPLHFEERTHIGYDEHVLDVTPNIHFRQDPHFEHYDHNGRAFDRNYRQSNPHGRLFDRDNRQPPGYANNENVDITRKVKLNAPEYDGKLDPNAFIEWLDRIEEYCDFYHD
ncbi:hypothetical protein GH714_031343 [Hevea brasiliensis]|uniref:Uncharacterized protein n=1 Tax=Hevea brasiliensis TaxID=3981 RepID=A0A6A6KEH2_HEVBR|nr:hypothetical protein GH714_031343 [Hevea brasiliensis]